MEGRLATLFMTVTNCPCQVVVKGKVSIFEKFCLKFEPGQQQIVHKKAWKQQNTYIFPLSLLHGEK